MQMPVYYNFILTFEQTPSAMKRIKLESRLQDIKYKTHRTLLQKVVVFIPLYQLYGKWQEVYELLVLGKSGGFISVFFLLVFDAVKCINGTLPGYLPSRYLPGYLPISSKI